MYTVYTQTSLETIKNEFEAKAKEAGFGLLNSYEFKQILHTKGHPIEKEIHLFEICNPLAAQKALSQIPEISIYLPCRISLYQEANKTVLSTIEAEEMLASIKIDATLKKEMLEVFETIKQIMHSWR